MSQIDIWKRIQVALRSKVGERLHQAWLEPATLDSVESNGDNTVIRIGVPGHIYRDYILTNFMPTLDEILGNEFTKPFSMELVISSQQTVEEPASNQALSVSQFNPATVPTGLSRMTAHDATSSSGRRDILNHDYTFSSFVVGPNNQFAHAACWSVADNPGKTYNPLFIHGPSGLGKTHLLNAVGNHIRQKWPHLRISYLSGERFLNDVISGIRHGQMERFRGRYREQCDVLLMDDIHIIAGKDSTQEEFFYTFNALHEAGKQVVVSSDKLPRDIEGLEERIRTRLEWGLLADIKAPDIETRMAILRYKSEKANFYLPDDVCAFIADISKTSIRELEGNLTRLKVFAELQEININLQLAQEIFSAQVQRQAKGVSFDTIQKAVADHFNVQIRDLKSESRVKSVALPRQVAMYLCRQMMKSGYKEIGLQFGGKDHSTVMHNVDKISSMVTEKADFSNEIKKIEGVIHNS